MPLQMRGEVADCGVSVGGSGLLRQWPWHEQYRKRWTLQGASGVVSNGQRGGSDLTKWQRGVTKVKYQSAEGI